MILAGDIGGTKTVLALFTWREDRRGFDREPVALERFDSRAFARFGEILRTFCDRHHPKLRAGCIGIAGPVRDNRCTATNLPWTLDGAELARDLGLETFTLVNDLEAVGFGIEVLRPDEMVELQAGSPGASGASRATGGVGNRAVIAAGTGLGEAGIYWDGASYRPFATEGGHADFAPRDELEIELLRFLLRRQGRVSWEQVLSGPGLENIYRFFLASAAGPGGGGPEPEALDAELRSGASAAAISKYAASGESARCVQALELFVKLYGAEAGNLALKTMATGGLYIGGGIAPKNLDWMRSGPFVEAFRDKDRMRPLLETIPVRILLNQQTALLGAARRARSSPARDC